MTLWPEAQIRSECRSNDGVPGWCYASPVSTRAALYQIRRVSPWGSYGSILAHGMTTHLPRRSDGHLALERTGPFIPDVTKPDSILVTERMRIAIEKAAFTGVHFTSVHKTRIVRYEWSHWDLEAQEPREYPESGEPEDGGLFDGQVFIEHEVKNFLLAR